MSSTLQVASFVWTKDEVWGLEWNGRHGSLNWRMYRKTVGEKLAPIIYQLFHHKSELKHLKMEIASLTLQIRGLPRCYGWVMTAEYHFTGLKGKYRCKAHFMPKNPGALDGLLYFTPPKYYGK